MDSAASNSRGGARASRNRDRRHRPHLIRPWPRSLSCFTVAGRRITARPHLSALIHESRTRKDHGDCNPINKISTGRPSVRFEDLPEDALYTIVSKLPHKEVARTSVLSSKWRCIWSTCPRLSFDGLALYKCERDYLFLHARKFITMVNGVLQKYHGKVVEALEIRFDFDTVPDHYVDSWVRFAVSSKTKNLAFDLRTNDIKRYPVRYKFPFQLFDRESMSRLQNVQLSFVSIKPPSQFRGFPNLRKLDLQFLDVSGKDLDNMLSNCSSLEWLSIDRCHLNDELKVDSPLPRLVYLRVIRCDVTKIEFNAVKLATFVYKGDLMPIVLAHSPELKSATLEFEANFPHPLTALLNGIPNMQNLTLGLRAPWLETHWLWDNPRKFSRLRHFQLFMNLWFGDGDKILYLVPFLRAAPFIERLEVHFNLKRDEWLADVGPVRQLLLRCEYNYLKNMYITGYRGSRGQLEFILHVVENAPVLEVLTVHTANRASKNSRVDDITLEWVHQGMEQAVLNARSCISRKLSPNVKFCII